jgi:aminoglycoside/choline kinase family phosphotransferase
MVKQSGTIPEQVDHELAWKLEEILRSLDISVDQWAPLAGDGSDRRIWRVGRQDNSVIVVFHPHPQNTALGITENDSFLYIRSHLDKIGVPVPRLLAAEDRGRWMILEDLGDTRLQDEANRHRGNPSAQRELYAVVLDYLPRIQVAGGQGFDLSKVHNPPYTAEFVRQWESGYFLRYFVEGYLSLRTNDPALEQELDKMAEQAVPEEEMYFLYRDFQSRNIIWQHGKPRFIDFQGGRTGPLAYDLASLVLDPYVDLPETLREELIEIYLEKLSAWISVDRRSFLKRYPLIAAHRMMQALGAYGYLACQKNKIYFLQYIPPALSALKSLLQSPELRSFKKFHALIEKLLDKCSKETITCKP